MPNSTRSIVWGAVAAVIAIGLVIGAASLSRSPDGRPAPSSGGRIAMEPMFRDLGAVPIRGGNVVMTYRVRNTDVQPLDVRRITTSCMCTTARLRIGDVVSPAFGMPGHGGAAPAWSGAIPPGGEATLEVTFDPLAHGPNGTGPIERAVYVMTSDPETPEAVVRFSGRVVPS